MTLFVLPRTSRLGRDRGENGTDLASMRRLQKTHSRCRVVESKCVRTHFSLSSAQDVTVTIFNARDVPKPPSGEAVPGRGARKILQTGDEKLAKLKPHQRAGKYISSSTDRRWESRFGLLPKLDKVLPPNIRKSLILLTISH